MKTNPITWRNNNHLLGINCKQKQSTTKPEVQVEEFYLKLSKLSFENRQIENELKLMGLI